MYVLGDGTAPEGRGAVRGESDAVQRQLQIVTRNRSELDSLGAGDRAIWNEKVFDLRSVIARDHRRKELEILAEEHL